MGVRSGQRSIISPGSYTFSAAVLYRVHILLKDKYFIITFLKCLFISLNYFIIFKIKYLKMSIH